MPFNIYGLEAMPTERRNLRKETLERNKLEVDPLMSEVAGNNRKDITFGNIKTGVKRPGKTLSGEQRQRWGTASPWISRLAAALR